MGTASTPADVQSIAAKEDAIPLDFLKSLKLTEELSDFPTDGVPVVDISNLNGDDDNDAAEQVAQACREWGFFTVINHGVSNELVQRMRDLALDYFHMPPEDRLIDWEIIIQPDSGTRDWVDSLVHFPKPYRPDAVPRTKFPNGYREALNQYVEEVLKLVKRLSRVLSVKLGLSAARLEEVMGELEAVVRVNYYPRCPCPELVTGLSAHSDAGILTVVFENEVDGLQVLKNGHWVRVRSVPNSLIFNVGDLLQIISNGTYVSCEHRAFVNPHSERLSLVVFVNTPGDLSVAPLPELLDEHHPPLYKPVTCNEYRDRYKRLGLNGKSLLETQST